MLGRPGRRAAAGGRRGRRDPRGARPAARCSGPTCSRRPGSTPEPALPALWELVWAGEVTNDAWTPLRAGRRYGRPARGAPAAPLLAHARHGGQRRRRAAGRSPRGSSPGTPDRRALAELLLERQGIVTRDGVRGEGIAGGYGAVYGELQQLETIGACRRGYFVEGLGGAQFALPGAVERLRELRGRGGAGAARARRGRSGAAVRRGAAVAEAGRARAPRASPARRSSCSAARRRSSSSAAAARSCRCASRTRSGCAPRSPRSSRYVRGGGAKRLAVERFDGQPVAETEVMPLLVEAGFLAGPRRAVLRP